MSIEDRRKAIIEAAYPLVTQEGITVSTKKIADAAGIAEGTLFRVFPTKMDLIKAVVNRSIDPNDLVDKLNEIDRELPLEDRVRQIVAIIQNSFAEAHALMFVMRQSLVAYGHGPAHGFDPNDRPRHGHAAWLQYMVIVRQGAESVLAPDKDQLAVDLPMAANVVLALSAISVLPGDATPRPTLDTLVGLITRAIINNGKDS